jgi:hypothetical protein
MLHHKLTEAMGSNISSSKRCLPETAIGNAVSGSSSSGCITATGHSEAESSKTLLQEIRQLELVLISLVWGWG